MAATVAVSPKAFAHISVRARNLDESVAWYTKVLGLRVAFRNAEQAFTTFDDEHHRVTYFGHPEMGPVPRNLGGFHHTAVSYPSLGQLLQRYRYLKSQGIVPWRAFRHDAITSLYYVDTQRTDA